MKDVVILFSAEGDTMTHTLKSTLFPSVVLLSKLGKKKDVDKYTLHLPAASDVENPVQQSAGETKSGCGQTLCIPGMIIAALHWLQFFSIDQIASCTIIKSLIISEGTSSSHG